MRFSKPEMYILNSKGKQQYQLRPIFHFGNAAGSLAAVFIRSFRYDSFLSSLSSKYHRLWLPQRTL